MKKMHKKRDRPPLCLWQRGCLFEKKMVRIDGNSPLKINVWEGGGN